jgi:hypothetical protein
VESVQPARPAAGRGAATGVLVGATAWALALAVVCIVAGRGDLLWPLAVPMLLASAGLGLLILAALRASAPAMRAFVVLGAVAVACGIMLLLIEGLVTPELEADERLGGAVRAAGGVLRLPRSVAGAMLAAGCALLAPGLLRRRGPPVGGASDRGTA